MWGIILFVLLLLFLLIIEFTEISLFFFFFYYNLFHNFLEGFIHFLGLGKVDSQVFFNRS